MRRNHLFCVVAIVAMADLFAACGPDTVVQVLPVETRTIYVCGDGSQVTDATLCPPTAPVVETRTEYVCRGGQIVDKAEKCPGWTVTCPPGTEPYMDEARHDDGCTYVATCHEGYAYVPETSTCVKVACPPGQTINAGGDDCVPVQPEVVTETVTIYVCADGSEVSMVEDCPPTQPVVETRTEYVCRGGTVVASVEQCPNWTVTCPPGTEPYMDEARHDDGCTYVATCHEGYAYDTTTSTCVKVACPPGQTLTPDGSACTMPEVRHNSCVADTDCAAGERCNTALTCVVPCHRDADCNDPSLWCGAPIIASDATLATCQLATTTTSTVISVSRAAISRPSDIILAGSRYVPVATYEFEAVGEAFLITSITLVNCLGFTIDDPNCNGIGATLGRDEAVTEVKIHYRNGNIEMEYVAFLVNGRVHFNNPDLIVNVGNAVNRAMPVTILVDTLPMENGNMSGARFQLNVAGFTAVGLSSGTVVTGNTAPANTMTIRITKPTVTLASGSPSGAAYQGFSEVLRTNVTADAAGYIGLNMIKFRLMSTDNAGTAWNTIRGGSRTVWLAAADFKMYNAMNPSEEIPSVVWLLNAAGGVAGEGDIVAQIAFYFDPHAIPIAAGMTRTFVLKMNTSGASSSHDDVVRTDITDIGWSDAGLSETIDGSLIKHLPVIGGTLIF